ncbi:MAG TPA: DUF1343 domain-containing protein [Gemmatimonadaceae bacterium]|nr:DUF1343 domain-containing protein [Gemmatimonadaceae bacterium]
MRTPLAPLLALAIVPLAACLSPRSAPAPAGAPAGARDAGGVVIVNRPRVAGIVAPGVDVLFAGPLPEVLRGKRVGLITNHTGIDRGGGSTADRLAAPSSGMRLVALYGPEHGIRGTAAPGERVEAGRDEKTGVPVHSLYGETRKPTPAMLEGVEVLVFDIQDVGARQYTYPYTMALAMQAAAEKGIPFVVLDRPNPVGGEIVEGNLLDTAFASFVGMYPIASRHGMTVGELARLFNREYRIGVDLTVVPAVGWKRSQWFDSTGLPWLAPSPNLPTLESATHYPGTVYLEGTNLTEGRGTDRPFEQTGAPWLRADTVVAVMNAMRLPGVRFEVAEFDVRPTAAKYPGQHLRGVRLVATDRGAYRPVATTLLLIDAVRRLHPDDFKWGGSIDRLAGTDRVRKAIEAGTLRELLAEWDRDAERFRETRTPYLIY